MKRKIRFLAALALCFCFITNCVPVQAMEASMAACTNHNSGNFYDSAIIARDVKWSHKVLINGEQQLCDVYARVIRERYICYNCGGFIVLEYALDETLHSISHPTGD